MEWDLSQWKSIIENREFLNWVLKPPSDEALQRARYRILDVPNPSSSLLT